MVNININEHVKFRLSKKGRELFPGVPVDLCNGESRLQLWEFCNTFGGYFVNGGEQLIIKNTIVLGDANEHPPFPDKDWT